MSLVRPVLRSPALRHLAGRRFESTAAEKATDAAKNTASRASQGLSRVTSAAGPAIAGAARGVTGTLSRMGGRTGQLIGFIERQTPFVTYYTRVGVELGRLVFQGQKMTPPSMATFQSFYRSLWTSIQNGSIMRSPQNLLQQARNLNTAQMVAGGVVLAECVGFFTVGEMIGRFKLVGYRGEPAGHH